MQFFQASGIVGIPLAVLTLLMAGLILRAVPAVRRGDGAGPVFAILFWGFVAAVLGFLGQCAGMYNALTAISAATEISPSVISRGFAESFSTTIWGSGLLLAAGLAWAVLRTWNARAAGGRA